MAIILETAVRRIRAGDIEFETTPPSGYSNLEIDSVDHFIGDNNLDESELTTATIAHNA